MQSAGNARDGSEISRSGWAWQGVLFALLGLGLGAALISGIHTIYYVQGQISTLATLLPIGYAFGAGMVATVNPCGILLLPSLVAYYIGQEEVAEASWWQRGGRALLLGLMATAGFVVLFGAVGLAIAVGGRALAAGFPVGGVLVGVGLTGLGLWLALSGRTLGILAASRAMGHVELRRDLRSLFFFGVAYGVASLACALPIFLVVAGTALSSGGIAAALGRFFSYALGMGVVLTAVSLGATFFQRAVTRSLRQIVPYVHRLSASFLIGAGIFVMYYWLVPGGLLGR